MTNFEDFLATGAATSLGGFGGGVAGAAWGALMAYGLAQEQDMKGKERDLTRLLSMWVCGFIGALGGAYTGYSLVQGAPSP